MDLHMSSDTLCKTQYVDSSGCVGPHRVRCALRVELLGVGNQDYRPAITAESPEFLTKPAVAVDTSSRDESREGL